MKNWDLAMICPLNEKYFQKMISIHINSLKGDFQVLLGKQFLLTMYKRYFLSEYAFGYIFLGSNDEPIGFVLAAYDIEKFTQEIIRKEFIRLFVVVCARIFARPYIIFSLIKQFCLNKNLESVGTKAELVTIAVEDSHRGQGVGKTLIKFVVDNFRSKGITSFKLTTDAKNRDVNNFYNKTGFKLLNSFDQFDIKQNIYVYEI